MQKVIAIDFDGTLCENKYPEIGLPRWGVIFKALSEQENGAALILWTCRTGKELNDAAGRLPGGCRETPAGNKANTGRGAVSSVHPRLFIRFVRRTEDDLAG